MWNAELLLYWVIGKMDVKQIEEYYNSEFENLVKRFSFRCGCLQDAEDIVQEAFAKALAYVDSYDSTLGTVDKWVGAILYRCWLNKVNEIKLGGVTKPVESCLKEIDPEEDSKILSATKKEIREHISSLADGDKKDVLSMHFISGMTESEIRFFTPHLTTSQIRGMIQLFRRKVIKRYEE